MEFLSEDPTYLVGGLAVVAAVFLVCLKVTQQGKYLVRALAAIGLGLMFLVVERLWVTDNERIEQAVYSLAKSVEASDSEGALAQMSDDVQFVNGGNSMPSAATRIFVKQTIDNAKFDFLRFTKLVANAGGLNPEACADALARLLDDRSGWDARRAAARLHVETNHDWARNARRYRDLYQGLLTMHSEHTPGPPMAADDTAAAA